MALEFEFRNGERGDQWIRMEEPMKYVTDSAVAELTAGSLFLSDGDMFLTELIGIWTILIRPILLFRLGMKNRYSHCGVVLGPDGMVVEAVPKGIIRGDLKNRLVPGSKVTVWSNDRMDADKLAVIQMMASGMVGKKYDWKQALSFVVPIGQDDNAYICSEAMGTLYAAVDLLPHKSRDWNPNDLADFLKREGHDWGWRRTLIWT